MVTTANAVWSVSSLPLSRRVLNASPADVISCEASWTTPVLQGFEQALAEVLAANAGKGLRAPPATEVKRTLDAVSEYRAPGKLVLRSEKLRSELAALDQPATEGGAEPGRTAGASNGAASKGRKRPAGKSAGSSADPASRSAAKGAAGKAAATAQAEASAGQHVSKKRRKEKGTDAGELRGSGRTRANEHGEPHVLNRQQVQPERPAHPGGDRGRSSVFDPTAGCDTKTQRDAPAREANGSGSEAGLVAGSSPPPVRWDIDVAAALGIGTGGIAALPGRGDPAAPRGVSPSTATSGAWASTSYGGGLLPAAALPSRERGTAAPHPHPGSRSLSAASAPGPGEGRQPSPSAIHQQGVPRLKIKLRVPPGSQSAGLPAGPASAGGSRRSSGSGGRSARAPYDDSWFAEHVGRGPRREFAIQDEAQVRTVITWSQLDYGGPIRMDDVVCAAMFGLSCCRVV